MSGPRGNAASAARARAAAAPRAGERGPTWRTLLALFVLTLGALLLVAPRALLTTHTAFNHFALQAEAWLAGRLDLGGPPPAYTQYNDFAVFEGRTFVSFPPLPALLLVPLVALAGGAARVPDGLVFLVLAALVPCGMLLALERARALGLSRRSPRENLALAALTTFGTVLFSTSVQGTVWFAAHVVGALLAALYAHASLGATRPALAGLWLGLGLATRTPLALAAPLFVLEAWRFHDPLAGEASRRRFAAAVGRFAAPLALVLAVLAWHNAARFGDPLEFGHRHLDVVWRERIARWGLFSPHYLGRNLGVMLASTPFFGAKAAPFQISAHGLALWITSPFLVLALFPRSMPRGARRQYVGLAVAAAGIALVDLLYQNTGWIQFGYRFSSDFVVFLVLMLAVGRRRLGVPFAALAALAVLVNLFGALSFQRAGWERFYVRDRDPRVVFEPDDHGAPDEPARPPRR